MKQKPRRERTPNPRQSPGPDQSAPRRRWAKPLLLWLGFLGALAAGLAVWHMLGKFHSSASYRPRPPGTVSFNKDIAPIIFTHCSGCHRPGQAAPFDLLAYRDVKKHAQQIVAVIQKRLMPPWPPEPGFGEFADERRLSADQLALIQQWVAEGSSEGPPSELPPLHKWPQGWHLGEPDLVLTMPQTYTRGADGPDVYRNFVMPIPLSAT